MGDLKKQVVKYLTDAHAMEQMSLASLKGLISTSDDPVFKDHFEHHHRDTEQQLDRIRKRLEALGGSPSAMKDMAAKLPTMAKGMVDAARTDNAGKNLRDFYANEHLEVAAYELLQRVAQRAGDADTATLAREICAEERSEGEWAEGQWDHAADLSLSAEVAHA
jgi:ferritin-like metal-binding protein YciE